MSKAHGAPDHRKVLNQRGLTLIETAIATSILVVVLVGLLGMASVATSFTENEGHLSARTTEYAVDKMEQLQELTYGDAQSNTAVFPTLTSGGTGLAIGGGTNTAAPVVGYSDYLDKNGNVLCTAATPCTATPPTDWFYQRVWQVTSPSANLKQITVTATIRASVAKAKLASATVMSIKTNCPTGC